MEAFDWFDDDEAAPMPLRPPQDRLWRHPSELAAEGRFLAVVPEPSGRASSTRSVTTGCVLALATAVAGSAVVTLAVSHRHASLTSAAIASTVTTVQGQVADVLNYVVDGSERIARDLTARPSAWLGISGTDGDKTGVSVVSVAAASPCDGMLLPGDVIVAVDDVAVGEMQVLRAYLATRQPGENVRVQVLRNGQPQTVSVTLGARLAAADAAPAATP